MSTSISVAAAALAGACGSLLLVLFLRRRRRRRAGQPLPPLSSQLEGATIVVTGASAGIGAALVRRLAATGQPAVIVAAQRRRVGALDLAPPSATTVVHQLPLDLSCLASVREFARRLREHLGPAARLTHLVCNAGVFFPAAAASADGLPSHAAVNFVANVALTRWLLGNGLVQPGYTRVLLVSSSLSRRGVAREATEAAAAWPKSAAIGYADSKACLNLLAQHLHANCGGLHACAAFTGGPVATELLLPGWLPGALRPLALGLLSGLLQAPDRVADDLAGLIGRAPDEPGVSGRLFSAGRPVAWPVELPPERLAEFVAGYERLVDSLLPPDESRDNRLAGSVA